MPVGAEKLPASPAAKTRDPLFDNIKGILIFCVVFAHMLVTFREGARDGVKLADDIYHCVYLFHMPLFVMVTGYFSKKSLKSPLHAVCYSLLPFAVFTLLFSLVRWLVLPEQHDYMSEFWYYLPFTYWYLFGVFVWKLLAKPLSFLRGGALPLLVVLGLAVGVIIRDCDIMAIGRVFAFFPYFWIGILLTPELIAKIRKVPKAVGLVGMAALFALFLWLKPSLPCSASQLLQLADSNAVMGLSPVSYMLWRLALYLMSTALCLCLIIAAPGKKTFFTRLGGNTIAVYLLHSYVVYFCVRKLGWFDGWFSTLNAYEGIAVSALFAAVMCAVFGLPIFTKGYNALTKTLGGGLERLFTPKRRKA